MNCLVWVDKDCVELVIFIQVFQDVWIVVQCFIGLFVVQIDICVFWVGGGYGCWFDYDFVVEVVMLVKMFDKFVCLLWMCEDDFIYDFYCFGSVYMLWVIVDYKCDVLVWNQCMVSVLVLVGCGVLDDCLWMFEVSVVQLLVGLILNYCSDWYVLQLGILCGLMCGMFDVVNVFVVESFIDEIVYVMCENLLDICLCLFGEVCQLLLFNGGMLDIGCFVNVFKFVVECINWSDWLYIVNGLGIVSWYFDGVYVVYVIEVLMKGEQLIIEWVVCVVDVGCVINFIGLEGQFVGVMFDVLLQVFNLVIMVKDGQVQQ